jgi:hypothetical protein
LGASFAHPSAKYFNIFAWIAKLRGIRVRLLGEATFLRDAPARSARRNRARQVAKPIGPDHDGLRDQLRITPQAMANPKSLGRKRDQIQPQPSFYDTMPDDYGDDDDE